MNEDLILEKLDQIRYGLVILGIMISIIGIFVFSRGE